MIGKKIQMMILDKLDSLVILDVLHIKLYMSNN